MPLARPLSTSDAPTGAAPVPPEPPTPASLERPRGDLDDAAVTESQSRPVTGSAPPGEPTLAQEHPEPVRERLEPPEEHPEPVRERLEPPEEHPEPVRERPEPPKEHPEPVRERLEPPEEHPEPVRERLEPPEEHPELVSGRADPTSGHADGAPSVRALARPLLASEALMDDLAPVEPSREAARVWCAALGLSFVIIGVLPLIGLPLGAAGTAVPSLAVGIVAMIAAAPGISYRQRALAMVALGLLSDVVGLQGTSVGGLGWNLTRLVPAIAVGAALMFRARYRAYTGARIFLGVALASSVPFLIEAALGFGGGLGLAQIGDVIACLAIASSFTGFMGAETTGAGPYLAHGVALTFAAELVLSALGRESDPTDVTTLIRVIVPALAFVGSSVLAALGLFQIVAWRFAADARRIDLHSTPTPADDLQRSATDWSTRE